MANFSAAFGYDFYIMPLEASSVAVDSVTSSDASTFLPTGGAYASNATVSYANGVFTVNGNAYNMNGTPAASADQPLRLSGLTSASLETDTGSEDVYTYDDETKGFNQAVATTKGFTISLSGVADFKDAAYQVLRLTEQNTVADALRVKFIRVGPTGTQETVFGYGTLMGYSESNEVASIVSWECTLTGYGAYGLELDGATSTTGGIASLEAISLENPFEISGTGLAATLSGGSGSGATVTVDTDGSGAITAYNITGAGTGYKVGDIVTVSEDSADGVAIARVTAIA